MNDQRGKEINKGDTVVALIAAGAQVVSIVADLHKDRILLTCDISLPVMPEQAPSVLVLEKEGPKVSWVVSEKLARKEVMDQRHRDIGVGDDVASLVPTAMQIVCTVTDVIPPVVVRGNRRGGAFIKAGSIVLAGEFTLPIDEAGVVPCVYLPPEETEDKTRKSSDIVVVN